MEAEFHSKDREFSSGVKLFITVKFNSVEAEFNSMARNF
jgi:hypothetical protein